LVNPIYETRPIRPVRLLGGLHRSRGRRRRGLGGAGDEAAGDDRSREGEEGVFHSVVFVVFVVVLTARPRGAWNWREITMNV
jgi:hypothetical protein